MLQDTMRDLLMGCEIFCNLLQVKLDLSCLQGIKDDMDFCCRLAKEELVVLLPGILLLRTWFDNTDHCIWLVQDIFFFNPPLMSLFCLSCNMLGTICQDVVWDTRIGSGSPSQSHHLLLKMALTGSNPSACATASKSDVVSLKCSRSDMIRI